MQWGASRPYRKTHRVENVFTCFRQVWLLACIRPRKHLRRLMKLQDEDQVKNFLKVEGEKRGEMMQLWKTITDLRNICNINVRAFPHAQYKENLRDLWLNSCLAPRKWLFSEANQPKWRQNEMNLLGIKIWLWEVKRSDRVMHLSYLISLPSVQAFVCDTYLPRLHLNAIYKYSFSDTLLMICD